jgi:hypothetical protein
MSSSTASTVAHIDYLDRIYDQNKKEAELAYTNHVMAAKELYDAQMRMMTAKRAIRLLNNKLTETTAAAAAATELVDRKCKAADDAECAFNAVTGLTRNCYGTEEKCRKKSPESPIYHAVSPVYSKKIEYFSRLPVNSGGDTPSYCPNAQANYCPVSSDYKPQKPAGNGDSPGCNSPNSYCPRTGEPIYVGFSSDSRTYSPHTPPPAKGSELKWGA